LHDVAEVESTLFFGDAGMKYDLQQKPPNSSLRPGKLPWAMASATS